MSSVCISLAGYKLELLLHFKYVPEGALPCHSGSADQRSRADGCYSVVAKRPSHYALASKPHLERMAKEEFFHIGESS